MRRSRYRYNPEGRISKLDFATIRSVIAENTDRLAQLGNWPSYIDKEKSVLGRLPENQDSVNAAGFDAGLACTLDLIPRDKQNLSAILHAAYTEEAVEKIRQEAQDFDPNSETVWWLAACFLCHEGDGTITSFYQQLKDFEKLIDDPKARASAARLEYTKMVGSFNLVGGIPFGIKDGSAQGAYIAGYDLAVAYSESYGIFFLSTFRPTLGLDDFKWSSKKDTKGRPMSGPVWGSKQFVKCATFGELARAIKQATKILSYNKPDFEVDDLLVNPIKDATDIRLLWLDSKGFVESPSDMKGTWIDKPKKGKNAFVVSFRDGTRTVLYGRDEDDIMMDLFRMGHKISF